MKIVKVNELTPIQSGMLFQYMLTNDKSSYMGTEIFELEGNIDADIFRSVLDKISDEYEVFRTNVIYDKIDKPKSVVIDKRTVPFAVHKAVNDNAVKQFTDEINAEQFKKGFDIQRDSLIRLDLVVGENSSVLIFSFHHILMDGYCAAMIADIIMKNYGKMIGRQCDNDVEYVPFSTYQDWIVAQDMSKSCEYWKEYLKGISSVQPLDLVQFGSDKKKNIGHSSLTIEFTPLETQGLISIASAGNATLNICMQWLWGLTLCRNFSCDKAVFGTVVSYRPAEFDNAEQILGPMINTVPVVFACNKDNPITEQLKAFRKSFLDSMEHSWIGLGEISKTAEDCENLIDHLFVYDNFPEMDFGSIKKNTGFQVKNFKLEERTEYALTLEVSKTDRIRIRFNFDSSKYSAESIERLAGLYKNICISAVNANDPQDIENVSEAYSHKLMEKIKTVSDSMKNGSITSEFEKAVKKQKDNIALEFNGEELSYNELDRITDALAWKLHCFGLGKNARIAIDITPSFEVITAMIAILKIGGCYVPFDLMLPEKRLQDIIKDADVSLLLTVGEKETPSFGIKNFAVDVKELKSVAIPEDVSFISQRNEKNISNIMFTSGTTAKPKGVVLNDGGVLGLVKNGNLVDYEKISCQFQNSSIAFDAATFEIWGGLLNGKRVVIIDKDTLLSDKKFADKIKENKNCCLFLTTTLFNNFAERNAAMFANASYVVTGGEKFSEYHGKLFVEACPETKLLNGYGPTESTTFTTSFEITPQSLEGTVPIGLPLDTRGVLICDENLSPLPFGSKGEIIIYGQGLAVGYCGDSKTTAEKFVTLPCGISAYKSGDLGYTDDTENIYFCARHDEQLKLRGFRISTEEIESALRECADILNAAVLPFKNKHGSMYLTAFVVLKDNNDSFAQVQQRITAELGDMLPYYMIPAEFVKLDALPVNSNGKLDKSLLKAPEEHAEEKLLPTTDTEKVIYDLFKEVMGDSNFGMEQSFINIGGDSIKAMKLTAISKKKGYNITVADLYREQTPARLAAYIDSMDGVKTQGIKEITPDSEHRYDKFPLNNVQVAYLSGRSNDLVLGGYGTVFFSDIEGDYNRQKFEDVLNIVIKRHDMLRAVIYDSGYQQILSPEQAKYELQEEDISRMCDEEQEAYLKNRCDEMKNMVFEIGKWPMFKVNMIRTTEDHVHVLYAFDALIMDAFSVIMLARELRDTYDGNVCDEKLELSFRDYVLETEKMQDEYEADKKFWMEKVDDFPSAPAFKFKTLPENIKSSQFSRKHMTFEKEVWDNIKQLSVKLNITPAVLLCGLYAYTLSLYSGQSQLAVNMTVFSREQIHRQVDKILGDFTKIVLLDYDFTSADSFKNVVVNSHKRLNEYLTHLHYDGIDFMRELAKKNKPVNGRPLMPVVFTSALFDNDIVYDLDKASSRTPQVYLDCQAMLQCGKLNVVWDYPAELYDSELIDEMFECFTKFICHADKMLEKAFPVSEKTEHFYKHYNDTSWLVPNITLQQLVKESLENEEYADNIWLYDADKSYTYAETRENVYRYAGHLQAEGIECGDFVCVEGERNSDTLFKILAVILCGGAYIPVQPSWPDDRKKAIKEQSGYKYLFDENTQIREANFEYHETAYDAPAYVIYTSGSTGTPKGVLINQSAVTNTLLDINERYSVTETDVFAAVSSFSFDLSVYDIFGSLSAGASVSLVRDMKNINEVINSLERNKVTIWNTVPALMGILTSELERRSDRGKKNTIPMRVVLMSGDWIPVQLPREITNIFGDINVVSLGGATEASIWSIAYDIDTNREYAAHIPYGYPLRNQKMYVLSDSREFLPKNVEGDIYIGGVGVADGYQNDQKQTDAAFINHKTLGRIYRTGDRGYISDEGCMEFCGRQDMQVKINGLRIELGDLDSSVKKIPGIKDSVSAVQTNDEGGDLICTYIRCDSKIVDAELDADDTALNISSQENEILSEFDIDSYHCFMSVLEKYSVNCMAEALKTLGIEKFSGERISENEIVRKLKIADNRVKNFRQWFNTLKKYGFIDDKKDIFTFDCSKMGDIDEYLKQLKHMGISKAMEQIVRCVVSIRKLLPDILLGKADPVSEVFFKDGDIQSGVGIYRNSVTGQIYGRLAAELTMSLIAANEGKPFRILEVGAGVGGTSDYVIDRIKNMENVTYLYTDISDVFLDEAKKRYDGLDFVDYGIFDINLHPEVQGMPLHSFDLIIGANVLHDAQNIYNTVDELHLLLAKNGKLMLVEATINTATQMITAGFSEGLTSYSDDRVETDLPAYSEEQWKNSIIKNNYSVPLMYPYDAKVREKLQTVLLLAQSKEIISEIDQEEVISQLKTKLPEYMLPRFIVEMQKFPLTANGKLDVKRLPKMSVDVQKRGEIVPPQTALQKELAELWKENLGVQEIGITDNYFALSGDSLKAIRLMSRIEEHGYHIDMNAIFRCTTIEDMEKEIGSDSRRVK